MAERSYTVKEIDDLRRACDRRWLWGSSVAAGGASRAYREEVRVKAVEEILRTHMLAGHIAEDILEEDRRRVETGAQANGRQ